jgi:membrane protease YdiL (CAAX protease family)
MQFRNRLDTIVTAVFEPSRIAPSNNTAVITGLAIAWGGTALLVCLLARDPDDPSRLPLALVGEALFWALAAAVVASVLFWEKQPLRSLWLQPFRWPSIAWGFFLVAVYYAMLFPFGEWVRRSAGLPGFGAGMDQVTRYPLWYRMIAVVGAGIGEEILFRGFSVTRLAMLTGRIWLAALVTLVGFCVLHVPLWGWGFALGGLVSGAAAMAFFIWRKDLLAMMIFHISTDAIGIVIAPIFSEWWRKPALF